jgi:hypothetical protein
MAKHNALSARSVAAIKKPGTYPKNSRGTSVSALATKFGDRDAAAAALGFSSVKALQVTGASCALRHPSS